MKCGLKTFPLSVDLDDSVKLVEAEFGVKGFAIVIKLYQAIYSRGYYMKWDIDAQLLFIRDYCLSEVGRGLVSEVVDCCIRRGVFEPTLYKDYQILTSKRIQETFLTATKRSIKVVMEEQYALPIVYEFIENVSKNGKNVNISFKNADNFQQRKGKERKGNNNTHTPPISPKGEWEDYEAFIEMVKIACPIIYNRHAKLINEKTKISVAGEVNKSLDEILQVYSIEELRELFEKVNQTYLVKPKYQNIDIAWVLNNIPKINQDIKEVEESQSRQPLYEVDEDGVVIGSVEEKPHRTKPVRQSNQEYMKSENERIMGVLGRLWQEAKDEEERAKNGQE